MGIGKEKMKHECIKMPKDYKIYSPEDENHWVLEKTIDCRDFTHTIRFKIIACHFCGVRL